jgi:hypothetical protein
MSELELRDRSLVKREGKLETKALKRPFTSI